MAYRLGARTEDPVDRVIDAFAAWASQPGPLFFQHYFFFEFSLFLHLTLFYLPFAEMRQEFEDKRAAQKAAKADKLAVRRATLKRKPMSGRWLRILGKL